MIWFSYPQSRFYSHVNYSVTKIVKLIEFAEGSFYSHVNYSVTKIYPHSITESLHFYSHVNYSVTKIKLISFNIIVTFTVT